MRRDGLTLQEVGERIGVTRERARQIILRAWRAEAGGKWPRTSVLAEAQGAM
jgi:hypothetical protein